MSPSNDRRLPLRFVVYHFHPVSARLRFLVTQKNHLCLPEPLPALSSVMEQCRSYSKVSPFPAAYLHDCCERWHLPEEELTIGRHFHLKVDSPGVALSIFLLQIQALQPFNSPLDTFWMELPECARLSATEQLILRHIYDWLME